GPAVPWYIAFLKTCVSFLLAIGTIRGGCLNAPAFIFLSGHLGLLFLPKADHAWLSMLLLVPGRLTSKEKSARKEPVCKKIVSRLAGSRLWETPSRGNV